MNSFVRTGGQIGGSHPVSSVPDKVLRHWLHPSISPDKRKRVGLYLANSRYWNNERRSFAAKVMKDAVRALEHGLPPPPVRADRRHLRAARAVDPAAAVRGHVREVERSRARDAALRQGRQLAGAGPARPGRAPPARALRGRGDDDRPLAGRAAEPRARPRAREPDRDRAGVRPRHPARRARLDGQDLDGPPPRPHARPDGDRRPRPPARRASTAATSRRPTTSRRRCSR